jgi:preprotein translocase subunit YajC
MRFLAAAPAAAPNAREAFVGLLPIILIFMIVYFLLIMPEQRKQKAQVKKHEAMIKGLKKNDKVITAGGIHGVVVNVKDSTVVLKVDDDAKIEIEKQSVSRCAEEKE